MKRLISILFFFLYINLFYAQSSYKNKSNYYSPYRYMRCWLGGIDYSIFNEPKGTLTTNFPYSVNNSSGITATHEFVSSNNNLFNKNAVNLIFPLINWEWGNPKSFWRLGLSVPLNNDYQGVQFYLGKGVNLVWDKNESRFYFANKRSKYVIRPSINIGYKYLEDPIGYIDNQNVTINALGGSSPPTFQYSTSSRYNSIIHTATTDKLNIYYDQSEFNITPRITFSNCNDYSKIFKWEIALSYSYSFYRSFDLDLTPVDSQNHVGNPIISNKANLQFNNNSFEKTPFNLSSFNISIAIGI